MKRDDIVHGHPLLTGNSQLVYFIDREELMNVLGFCETRAEEAVLKEELREVPRIKTDLSPICGEFPDSWRIPA